MKQDSSNAFEDHDKQKLFTLHKQTIKSMKKILILLISIFLFEGCCVFNSRDCGCEPPPEEFLIEEPKEWLRSFENGAFQIFQDNDGNLDSLEIEIVQTVRCIGGDECCSDSEIQRVNLKSINRFGVRLSIEGLEKNHIATNDLERQENFIKITMNAETEEFYFFGDNSTARIMDDFDWNGESITVLRASCTGGLSCSDYKMKKFFISKDLGLLEFEDRSGNIWRRIN